MAKGSGNPAGKRPSSRNAKPYDANNSFVRKMATKVTDFIPQSSWISKWFNTSQDNEDVLEGRENTEETEFENDIQQPPSKRARIRMDVIHPPGTFSIQTRAKTLNTIEPSKEQYPVHSEMTEDFMEPAIAGPSGIGHLISSTPAVQADIRAVTSHRSDLNSLASSTNNGIANGMDDNSESSESTSGCSSLIPQINRHEGPSNLYNSTFPSRKRHIDDKLTFTNHLQSPRSLFLDSNSRDTLSSRRPSFNASIITNTLDRASPLSSPFYSGNTTFGGANTAGLYKRSRNFFSNSSELQLKVPRRTSVEVKPSNAVDSSGMSQTAKKILEALEHFSSPISDAKKIPLKNTNSAMSSAMSRKKEQEETASSSHRFGFRHLARELTVPTVPDILKLRRRQKLQDTTLVARKIVSARNNPPPSPQEYRLRTEDTDSEKYRGKLKGRAKIFLDRQTVVPVNLPNIPLPITTLPNFNFALPPPASHSAGNTIANKENTFTFASPIKVTDAGKNLQSVNNFTFSNPINAEESTNNMIDSSSRSITGNIGSTTSSVNVTTTSSMPNFIWSGSSTAPRLKAKHTQVTQQGHPSKNSKDPSRFVGSAMEFKPESVMHIFCSKSNKMESNLIGQSNSELISETARTDKTSTFVSTDSDIKSTRDLESSWECSECLIKNSSTNEQCTACKMARPNPDDKTTSPSTSTTETVTESKPVADNNFGSQFKLSTNQWECTTCCVRNKQSDAKCVACTTLKPGSNSVTQQTIKPQNDLMEKFKPAEGSWECPGCLLRNAVNVITCPCCNASNPISVKVSPKKTNTVTEVSSAQKLSTTGTEVTVTQGTISSNSEIMNKFKPSKDSWECPGCLVRNNNFVTTCPCCNTSKPGSVEGPSKAEQTSANGFGDKFKKPEGAWICDSCLVQNDAKHTQCVACQVSKPGTTKSDEPASNTNSTLQFSFGIPSSTSTDHTGGFKFGIDKADNQSKLDTASPLNGFKFGNTQQNSGIAQFTFGIPKEENKAVNEVPKTNSITTSSSSNTGFLFKAKTPEKSESTKQDQVTKQEIPFNVPKSESATTGEKQNTSVVPIVTSSAPSFTFGMQKPEFNATNNEAQKTSFATKEVSSSTSLFNKNSEPKTTIAFGTDKPSAFTATVSKPSAFVMPENKIPTFGNNTESKPPIFGTSETKLPVFNPPAANPLPTFVPPSSSATPSLFGSSNTSAFGNNTTLAFGSATTTPAIFSSTKPSETNTVSSSSLFTFGSASSQQSASGGFNFSANVNPPASSTKPLFAFGNNSNTPQSNNNTFGSGTFAANSAPTNTANNFTFNPPKQETPAPFSQQSAIAPPMFGSPQTNPQTQVQATSSFSTLSSTPSSNTGFNFGSAAPPAAPSGGFNFGGMSSTSTTTGGFNFNPPTCTPSIAFDPNSRPSFNFTKGSAPTSFNAPPQSAAAPRKIKKAFRRCMR